MFSKRHLVLLFIAISTISFAQVDTHPTSRQLDACSTKYFYNRYFNPTSQVVFQDFCNGNNGEILVCGEVRVTGGDDGFIMKLDHEGNKIWELTLGGDNTQEYAKITKLADGNYIAVGFDNTAGLVTWSILKFTDTGTVLWKKDHQIGTSSNFSIPFLKEDDDGSLILVCAFLENLSFTDRMLYLRFNSTGDILISNFFKPPVVTSVIYLGNCLVSGDDIYIVGSHVTTIFEGLLMKVNKLTGNLAWTKTYKLNNGKGYFAQIFPYNSNQFCIIGSDDINETDTAVLLLTDFNGNVQSSNYFRYNSSHERGFAGLDADKKIVWSTYYRNGPNSTMVLSKIDPVTGPVWVKNYPLNKDFPRPGRLSFDSDSSILVAGYENGASGLHGYMGRFSSNGDYGCTPEMLPYSFGNIVTTMTNQSFLQLTIPVTPISRPPDLVPPLVTEIDSICYVSFICDSISLSQPSPICDLNDTISIAVTTNNGCPILPLLNYDHSHLSLVSYANGFAKFLALRPGNSMVTGVLQTSCNTFKDSVNVVSHQTPLLSLGPDTSLCPGNTILLKAAKGFQSYLWQDGSTDSIYTATTPGIYFVEVVDSCGRFFRDTVNITAAPPIPFNIGPDRVKCNSDTIHVDAPSGFLNYLWSPPYNISSTTAQNVVVNPVVDTTYTVKAEKTPGCFAFDTVVVTVHHSPLINLGADKNLCNGDSAILDAGVGFNQYQWSTGSLQQQITVNAAGNYSVIGTTSQGCKSYDTLRILNLIALPVINLNRDSTLCSGDQRILDAGSGFANYLWSNGSNQQTITVNTTGIYSVVVNDVNGCSGGDTTKINTILPSPSAFLPPDTAICSYGTLSIKSNGTYSQYLWNTGSTTAMINITQPGVYWLRVVDNSGCIGRDSVTVNPKDCMKGFFIPSAFTPNADGRNDNYKPLLFGKVIKYDFTIYNRWGEIVFHSTELNKAWDGKYAGRQQDTNLFVWICSYQFEGEELKIEKGTVVLIR